MAARQYSAQEKNDAMVDFVSGQSVERIAKARGIPLHTVSNWYSRYGWGQRRHEYRSEITRRALNKLLDTGQENVDNCMAIAVNLSRAAKEKSAGATKLSNDEMNDLAKIALLCANIADKALPSANDEIIGRLVDALRAADCEPSADDMSDDGECQENAQ